MAFGSGGFGMLADKLGRRWTLAIAVALFSIFTAAAALATGPIVFAILRFIAGLGLGGVSPVLNALAVEYSPIKIRARLVVVIILCGTVVGGVLAALVGKALIARYGWQAVYVAAGPPVVLIPFILKYIPESLSLLVKMKRDAELRAIVTKISPSYPLQPEEQFLVPHEDEVTAVPISRVFQDGRAFSTVMIWIAHFACYFMIYAVNAWLTKLLATLGYSLGSALNFQIVYNIGVALGVLGGGWLLDKVNPKGVLFSFHAMAAVSLVTMGVIIAHGAVPVLLVLMVCAVGAFTIGTAILTQAYGGMFYPAAIRNTACGLSYQWGRVGGALGPVTIGWIVGLNLAPQQNLMAIAVFGVIGAIAIALVNHSASASAHHIDAVNGGELKREPSLPQAAAGARGPLR
jgi:MFS transporter, AAHS family, benzoate transport protein